MGSLASWRLGNLNPAGAVERFGLELRSLDANHQLTKRLAGKRVHMLGIYLGRRDYDLAMHLRKRCSRSHGNRVGDNVASVGSVWLR